METNTMNGSVASLPALMSVVDHSRAATASSSVVNAQSEASLLSTSVRMAMMTTLADSHGSAGNFGANPNPNCGLMRGSLTVNAHMVSETERSAVELIVNPRVSSFGMVGNGLSTVPTTLGMSYSSAGNFGVNPHRQPMDIGVVGNGGMDQPHPVSQSLSQLGNVMHPQASSMANGIMVAPQPSLMQPHPVSQSQGPVGNVTNPQASSMGNGIMVAPQPSLMQPHPELTANHDFSVDIAMYPRLPQTPHLPSPLAFPRNPGLPRNSSLPGNPNLPPGNPNMPMNPRRPAPGFMGQQPLSPDHRIHELNKRLQQRNEESDNLWWDAFATEFFEDDASLTLTFCLEDGPKRYTIGRTLIPRYFRSIFEGGVTDLYYVLKHPKESFQNTTINVDCEQASMVTQHGKPMFPYVITEGRLILEFTFDDLMRIRSWHFAIRQHRELLPRNVAAMQQPVDPAVMEQITKNITRQGLTNYTLNFLRLCVILEPMQELMSRHKAYGLNPRDCLKTTLFQKWQRMVAPPKETARPNTKRRKRKGSAGNNSNVGNNRDAAPTGKQKRSPGPHGFNIGASVPGDVMVVGEPTLMGGEFGDEDERLITRLENHQFDGTGPGPDDEGNEQKFSTSPAWAQGDKKTPPAAGPPPNSINPEQEIKTE